MFQHAYTIWIRHSVSLLWWSCTETAANGLLTQETITSCFMYARCPWHVTAFSWQQPYHSEVSSVIQATDNWLSWITAVKRPQSKGLAGLNYCKMPVWLQELWLDAEDVQLLKEGEEVTLMDWGNAIVQTISKSADGKTITGMHLFCASACIHMGFFFPMTAGSNCVSCLIRVWHQHLCWCGLVPESFLQCLVGAIVKAVVRLMSFAHYAFYFDKQATFALYSNHQQPALHVFCI